MGKIAQKLFVKSLTLFPQPPKVLRKEPKPPKIDPVPSAGLPAPIAARGDISVSLGQHWGIFGTTGSGKTTFTTELMKELRRAYEGVQVYICDSKNSGDFDNIAGAFTYQVDESPPPLKAAGNVQIWQPGVDSRKEYDEWLNGILKNRKPAIVLIDELSSLGGNDGRSFPPGLSRLLKQGRSLKITVLVCSQGVTKIPDTVLGQITHVVRFRLQWGPDIQRIDTYMRRAKGGEPKANHGYIYYKNGSSVTHEYRDYHDFFRKRGK